MPTACGGSAGILRITAAGAQDATDLAWITHPGVTPHAIEPVPTTGAVVTASSAGHLNVYAAPGPTRPPNKRRRSTCPEPMAHCGAHHGNCRGRSATEFCCHSGMTGSGTDVRLEPTGDRVEPPGMGHDLQPGYQQTGDLLITHTEAVYRVNPQTLSATVIADIRSVKSYVRDSSGQAIWLQARGKPPRPWSSPVVSFESGPVEHRDGQIYKARLLRCE